MFGLVGFEVPVVDAVYPQTKIKHEDVDALFNRWIKVTPSKLGSGYDDEDVIESIEDDERDCDEGNTDNSVVEETLSFWAKKKHKAQKTSGSVIDVLNDNTIDRETKLFELTRSLDYVFPRLKGDEVTFIGTTFMRYGDEEPYMNHCVVRNSCTDLPQVKNSVIESYDTEREVMLAWTELIQREDPDIVIGYNIFGFDYQFMYLRAKELDCVKRFLQLSRNKGEVCLNKDWRTGKEGLEENTLFIASGQHDLKFVNMTGRLQVDLYNYLRRDYQLIKYKLDYVAGYFIGDSVKKIEHIEGRTKIYSKNLTGLENSSFVNFEEEAHSVDNYKDCLLYTSPSPRDRG